MLYYQKLLMFNKKIKTMIKVEYGMNPIKGMVVVTNPYSRCLCGSHYDGEGICANRHVRGAKYFVPENMARKHLEKENVPVEIKICRNINNHCSVCGAPIPEGDNICDNHHMVGLKYPD